MKQFVEAILIPMVFVLAFFVPSLVGYIKWKEKPNESCIKKENKLIKNGFLIVAIFSLIATFLIFYYGIKD